ncbi:EAL domain-containing protein [Domibacillus sp. DTU_2020_1001157_1_SI_ALB_TIR_016]|uniref:sensor domain-containing protein n=1 Tax=Domibacillus sp. DTU_2020_1001157_1_SI_ALB_TIR_016 TaxID=3077789 RepID=UPI0028E85B79|nr:EAL domain-containing protein [Domibacillus sp. DTU_2020_1001157_1_SI_ALB_TIR_016]WNS82231.1 EAL domain-containing protein [Domibacillus sp. DTU_2020_1001157_1_SI_ALB_TIR_016]
MKYIGRIGTPLFADFAYFFWTMKLDFAELYNAYHLLSLFFFSIIAWWIGRHYDYNRNLNEKLKEKKNELQSLLDNVDAAIWSIDYGTNRLSLSKGFEKILDVSLQDAYTERTLWRKYLYHEDYQKAVHFLRSYKDNKEEAVQTAEFRIVSNGQMKWVEVKLSSIRNEKGELVKTNGVIMDITERKQAEERIKHLAYIDSLTGLPNRTSLFIDLNKRMQEGKETALFIIDLDRFKTVNDSFGHLAGDTLLKEAATRFKSALLEENGSIYRFGGDEFWLVCHETNNVQLTLLAEKLLQTLTLPFMIQDHEIVITPSIGISTFPADANSMDTLLVYADSAMHIAKEKGRNNYQFFNSSLYNKLQRKAALEKELRRAIWKEELFLHYQPQFDLATSQITGFEALIRWKNERFGSVSPSEFIPIAEESGLITSIGEWVLKEACLQSKRWEQQRYGRFSMSVNISVQQFQNRHFVDTFKALIRETHMEPSLLQIEITESIMQNTQETKHILDQLKEIGVKVSIDDFGTGYSSLSVLKELPLDCLKIDQSFIRDVTTSKKEAAIVKNIIDLAHNLELNVVAEGVETEGQLCMLKKLGCQTGQGYLFSKPLLHQEAEELLVPKQRKIKIDA